MWSHLQPAVKGMFWHTFHHDGDRYGKRPSAEEWLKAFQGYKRWLASGNNFDPMSNDVYPTRYRAMAADTPIYECAQCQTSMAGIWKKDTETYSTPKLCRDCQHERQKCQDCGKHGATLSAGRCRECNRKRNFGDCADCGKEVRREYLVDGRCASCQLVPCRDCGGLTRKSEMSHGRCPACEEETNALDSSRLCRRCGQPFIRYGNVAWHQRMGRPVPVSHKTGDPDCVTRGQSAGQYDGWSAQQPSAPAPQPLRETLEQRLRDS
jgi:hypothetical protein